MALAFSMQAEISTTIILWRLGRSVIIQIFNELLIHSTNFICIFAPKIA